MGNFELPRDYKDFLEALRTHDVEYAVAGAYAMAAWGYVRATGDLDILILPTPENAKKLFSALKKFGAPLEGVSESDFTKKNLVYQMGRPPLRIDILTSLSGVTITEDLMNITSRSDALGVAVPVISLDILIENKRATGRTRDLADVDELEKLKKKNKS